MNFYGERICSFSGIGKKIGLIGGSFDPIHNAHLSLARRVIDHFELDCVVFIPAAQNPLKLKYPTSPVHRIEMLRRALEGQAGFCFWLGEIDKGGVSYTVETVREIRSQVGSNCQLFWILGSDCLSELSQWREIEEISTKVHLVMIERESEAADSLSTRVSHVQLPAQVKENLSKHLLSGEPIPIQATDIRMTQDKLVIQRAVPESVFEYIVENKLYSLTL